MGRLGLGLGLGLGLQLGIGIGFRRNHSWSSIITPRRNHSLCLQDTDVDQSRQTDPHNLLARHYSLLQKFSSTNANARFLNRYIH